MRASVRTQRRVALFVGVTVVLASWLGLRALQIRSHLLVARAELAVAASPDLDRAVQAADRATREVDAAHAASRDPLWRLAGAIPALGATFGMVSDLTDISRDLVHQALPPLRAALREERAHPLVADGRVDLASLARLAPLFERASTEADTALQRAGRLPDTPLDGQRDTFQAQVQRLTHSLGAAKAAVDTAPGMLGRDRPRRYFLAVQNNAESRATGGLIGAYAIVRVDKGRITRERVGTDQDFVTAERPVVDLGQDFADHYDKHSSRTYWSAAVLTPDWSSAGAIIAGLWRAQGGGPIDGVIGIDPITMRELLRATGPVTVGTRSIGPANVVDFVMRDEYAEFPYPAREVARKQVLRELAGQLFDRVLGASSSTSLLTAVTAAGGSGHLQLWSADAAEQATIARFRVGGVLTRAPGAFLEVVTQNAAGNKIDYYVRRKLAYSRPAPGTGRAELTLRNLVDPATVPPIVTGRLDHNPTGRPGETKLLLTFFVSVGASVREVTVDGILVPVERGTEKGHGFASLQVLVAPGRPVTVVALLDDPGGPLTYRQQPLVVDDELSLAVPRAGAQ